MSVVPSAALSQAPIKVKLSLQNRARDDFSCCVCTFSFSHFSLLSVRGEAWFCVDAATDLLLLLLFTFFLSSQLHHSPSISSIFHPSFFLLFVSPSPFISRAHRSLSFSTSLLDKKTLFSPLPRSSRVRGSAAALHGEMPTALS